MPRAATEPVRHEDRRSATPGSLGFRMPAEWEPHERCLICWPTEIRHDLWGEQYLLAKASYAAVAHAIARFEPVLLIARPGEGGVARSYCGGDVEVIEMPIDDSWLRDSGPIFLTRGDGARAVADFTFNAWGEKYHPYDSDAAVGRLLAEHFGVERFAAPMVLEGGGITVDGQGTLITTESCLLHPSRNPGLSKDEMSQILGTTSASRRSSGSSRGSAWRRIPTPMATSTASRRSSPRAGCCSTGARPAAPRLREPRENRRRLETTDARGREIEVVEFDHRGRAVLVGDTPIVETYINAYEANGALIVPTAGTGDDEAALERLARSSPAARWWASPARSSATAGAASTASPSRSPEPRRRH